MTDEPTTNRIARKLFDDDRGVSPVIATVLMVAITIILAATAANFFFEPIDEQTVVPTTKFDVTYAGGNVTITHLSGEVLDADNTFRLDVGVDGAFAEWDGAWTSASRVGSGDSTTVSAASGQLVEVRWVSPNDRSSHILESFRAP